MMVVATAFSGGERNGFCLMLLSSAAGVRYLATPENDWGERVHPYVADWMVPRDEPGIRWFFEGMPEGESIPWEMWLPPLFWWLLFMMALWTVSICAMVILRRQWVEHEHLIYPITKAPLAMVEPPPGGSLVAPFFKKGLMWVGMLISFGRESLNALNHYFPFVPVIPRYFGSIQLLRGVSHASFSLNLMILGFAYFLKSDVMLGMWVFHLLRRLEEGVLHMTRRRHRGSAVPLRRGRRRNRNPRAPEHRGDDRPGAVRPVDSAGAPAGGVPQGVPRGTHPSTIPARSCPTAPPCGG